MNTYKFCKEFEKIFGRSHSKRISRKQRIISGGSTFISSPCSNFLYEMSLYADMPVSEYKKLFGDDSKYLFSLCDCVYRRFRKRFRKNCKKSGLATYITGQNLHKCFSSIVMLDTFFDRIFSECRLTFEFIFYETVVLSVELYLRRKIEKRNLRKISTNTENLFRKNEDFGRNYSSFDCKSLHKRR